jgi:hypothetical protein
MGLAIAEATTLAYLAVPIVWSINYVELGWGGYWSLDFPTTLPVWPLALALALGICFALVFISTGDSN